MHGPSQTFAFDGAFLTRSFWVNSKLKTAKFGPRNWRYTSIIRCKMYFDTLNRIGEAHECDRWTDRQMNRQTKRLLAIALSNKNFLEKDA